MTTRPLLSSRLACRGKSIEYCGFKSLMCHIFNTSSWQLFIIRAAPFEAYSRRPSRAPRPARRLCFLHGSASTSRPQQPRRPGPQRRRVAAWGRPRPGVGARRPRGGGRGLWRVWGAPGRLARLAGACRRPTAAARAGPAHKVRGCCCRPARRRAGWGGDWVRGVCATAASGAGPGRSLASSSAQSPRGSTR